MKKEILLSEKALQLVESFETIANIRDYEEDRGISATRLSSVTKDYNIAYNNLRDYIIKLEQENKKLKKKIKENDNMWGKGNYK